MDALMLLWVVLLEHRGPTGSLLVIIAVLLLNRYGALPRFPWHVPAARITPRTPEQEAADTQRIADLRVATAQIKHQFTEDGDGPRRLHPITVFETEHALLTGVQRRIRLEQRKERE